MNDTCRRLLLPAMLVAATFTTRALAKEGCCAHCGCQADCQRVCRLVCEEKKVEVFCWACKCEDFCVARHSTPGCEHCKTVCDDCEMADPKAPHPEPKRIIWLDWFPHGAKVYSRTKLMRKTENVSVPSYKWVFEEMCAECTAKLEVGDTTPVATKPPQASEPVTR